MKSLIVFIAGAFGLASFAMGQGKPVETPVAGVLSKKEAPKRNDQELGRYELPLSWNDVGGNRVWSVALNNGRKIGSGFGVWGDGLKFKIYRT
jgi:hypothetical protein